MKLVSVGSSSSGNSYIVKAADRLLVLDAGLSCIRITRALAELGAEPSDVSAILITHEHSDHVRSVRALAGKCENARIYVSRGTLRSCSAFDNIDEGRIRLISAGEEDTDDGLTVRAFSLSHDANEPVGYSLIADDGKLSVVTDTGVITGEMFDEISDCTMLVLEANHDEHLLMYGAYPYHLKMRIKSDEGHLSNRAAGELLAELLAARAERTCTDRPEEPLPVMLAHLSFHNNMPFRARSTIEDILEAAGFRDEEHYTITIAAKDEVTVFER